MHLDYQTGRETVAIFEPDYEQIIVLLGLVALCDALGSKNRRINGNYIKRRKIAQRSTQLRMDVRNHLARASTSPMHLMGEFELEAVQCGTDELLAEDSYLRRLAKPLIPGGDELGNQLDAIAKAEKLKMYAETIHLALSTREMPANWQPVFKELDE